MSYKVETSLCSHSLDVRQPYEKRTEELCLEQYVVIYVK